MSPLFAVILGTFLFLGLAMHGYFLYKFLSVVAILKASPDVPSANVLLKAIKKPAKPKKRTVELPDVAGGNFTEAGVARLREMQDNEK